MKPVKDVDEYIALAPKEVQDKLKEFRATIKTAAPSAQERISYGMPITITKADWFISDFRKNILDFTFPLP